jgi:hypothetical protein
MLLLRRQVEISTRRKISYKNFFDILLWLLSPTTPFTGNVACFGYN